MNQGRLYINILVLLLFLQSCGEKKRINITSDNLREVLTQYGKDNPEDELIIETDFGNMRVKLYRETPLHRANFIKLIKEGQYENATFYRVFYQFMVQGGIFPQELNYTIPAEFNPALFHKKGALAMARSDENNPNLESSSTEFFIVQGSKYADYQVEDEAQNNHLKLTPEQKNTYMTLGGYMSLDQQYTVFGEVVDGLDVIDKIASVKVYNEDKPLKKIPLTIKLVDKK